MGVGGVIYNNCFFLATFRPKNKATLSKQTDQQQGFKPTASGRKFFNGHIFSAPLFLIAPCTNIHLYLN